MFIPFSSSSRASLKYLSSSSSFSDGYDTILGCLGGDKSGKADDGNEMSGKPDGSLNGTETSGFGIPSLLTFKYVVNDISIEPYTLCPIFYSL